ncbi:MAG TPA: hypothetical protein DCY88_19115 [Cyanobacteria bacterium UBA11372]|nr:hypothetical protein [Cyanobacteria bacterium UBA11372]
MYSRSEFDEKYLLAAPRINKPAPTCNADDGHGMKRRKYGKRSPAFPVASGDEINAYISSDNIADPEVEPPVNRSQVEPGNELNTILMFITPLTLLSVICKYTSATRYKSFPG